MYAHANFDDYANVQIASELWDDVDFEFTRDNLSANWIEWIINTEAPLLKVEQGFLGNLYWGIRYRLRFLVSDIKQPEFDIFAIPGYGKTYSSVIPAINLYVRYRIEF